MNKKNIWIAIIGAGLIASITTATGFFPEFKTVLASVSGLIAAVLALLNKKE